MEVLLVLVAALVIVVAAAAGVAVSRRRGERLDWEPEAPAAEPDAEPQPEPERLPWAGAGEAAEEEPAGASHHPSAQPAPVESVPGPLPAPEEEPPAGLVEVPARPRFRDRLGKARGLFAGYVGSILSRSAIDDDTWDELEEALIRADVGVATTTAILDDLRNRAKSDELKTPQALLDALKGDLKAQLAMAERDLRFEPGTPNVWLFVGVNGVGKTTTIGKVGRQQAEQGRSVVMAAADTFRAAAGEQLELWAKRVGADLVKGAEGADPGSVVFDAVQRAAARGADLVLADTAGRLHTKTNLMEELRKVRRVAERDPGRVTEVLLVIDATTGQNGLVQAKEFAEAVGVTGVVLTKLDGSAKGGIVLAIQQELDLPVKLVGLGETADDLVAFDPDEFVEALFS